MRDSIARISGASRMWYRNYVIFRKLFIKSMAPTLLEPFLYLFSLGLGLGLYVREIQGVSYIQFIAPGFMASSAMFAASYECTFNSFIRMRFERVYDAILATPLEADDIILGEILWAASRGFLSSAIFLLMISIFGLADSAWAVASLPIVFLAAMLFGIYGMIFTAIIPEIALFTYYFTLFITPLFLFSGIFYPISSLPGWAQTIAVMTPLYHFVEVNRALILGKIDTSILVHVAYLAISVIVLLPVPIKLMRKRMIS